MKKILFLSVILFIVSSYSFANYNSSSNAYKEPIIDNSLKFRALLKDWKVYTSWTKFNKNEWFKFYKVIRSQEVSNPVYPDNGYIKYSSDINFTSYVDKNPPKWKSYYRVCAITTEKNRYCSNVVTIYNNLSDKKIVIPENCQLWYDGCNNCSMINGVPACTKRYCVRYDTPRCLKYKNDNISDKLKIKIDNILKKFFIKIDNKYKSNDKKISILKEIISKLNNYANNKPKYRNIVNYINSIIEKKIKGYQDDLWDIVEIFEGY